MGNPTIFYTMYINIYDSQIKKNNNNFFILEKQFKNYFRNIVHYLFKTSEKSLLLQHKLHYTVNNSNEFA